MDWLEALAAELGGGGAAVAIAATDMRREADVVGLFALARERFGGVDVLVNAAGLGKRAPLGSAPTDVWREMLEVNVLGLAIATREAIRDMEGRGGRDRGDGHAARGRRRRPLRARARALRRRRRPGERRRSREARPTRLGTDRRLARDARGERPRARDRHARGDPGHGEARRGR